VIVASSSNEQRKAVSFGAESYLDKPIDVGQLLKLLDDFTGSESITKVLLVDDEEVSRYLVRQLLPRGAFVLSEAATGREGLEALKENRPDVILLDVNMPEMTGTEFLERLQSYNGVVPPAIVITSMVLDDADKARLRGASRIMSKFDLTTDALVVAIRESLDKVR
jgi:CheY-like chemotaxis protein